MNESDKRESIEPVESENTKNDQEVSGSDEAEYEVEAILGVKPFVKEDTLKYQIRWVGYSQEYDSWEPEENLTGAEEALKIFKQTHDSEFQHALQALERHKTKSLRTRGFRRRKSSSATPEKKEFGAKRVGRPPFKQSLVDELSSDEDDEKLVLTKRKRASRHHETGPTADPADKQTFTSVLAFSPRKQRNSWMYKDLDDETDDGDNFDNNAENEKHEDFQPSASELLGHEVNTVNETSKKDDIVEEKKQTLAISAGGVRKENGNVAHAGSNADEDQELHNEKNDRFINCIQMPDGSIHLLRTEGSGRSLLPLKEAHDRFGFEVVEYLISHGDFS